VPRSPSLRSLALVALALAGCPKKPAAPPAAVRPGIGELTVEVLPLPGGATVDGAALVQPLRKRLEEKSGLPLAAPDAVGPSYKIRLELSGQINEDAKEKRVQFLALARARLKCEAAPPGLPLDDSALAEKLADPSPTLDRGATLAEHVQKTAERLIGAIGEKLSIAHGDDAQLIAALEGPSTELRQAAAHLAGERKLAAAVPTLLKLLGSTDPEIRDVAIGALREIGDRRAVRPLTELARFREVGELPKIIDAVGKIGGEEARQYLEFVAAGHDSAEVRQLAKRALEHMDAREKK
jgi:hypothetical protein